MLINKLLYIFLLSIALMLGACSGTTPTGDKPGALSPSNIPDKNETKTSDDKSNLLDNSVYFEPDYFYYEKNPQWSPDGKKIVFLIGNKIYVAGTDGSKPVLVTDLHLLPDFSLFRSGLAIVRWSPTQEKIFFSLYQSNTRGSDSLTLFAINPDGSNLQKLRKFDQNIDYKFFPDGKRILISDGGLKFYVSNLDRSNEIDLIKDLRDSSGNSFKAQYYFEYDISSDGKKLILGSDNSLVLIDIDTRKFEKIFKKDNCSVEKVKFSPDNKKVMFSVLSPQRYPPGGSGGSSNEIFTINIDGTVLNHINNSFYEAEWSPDSKKIVYSDQKVLYTVDSDGKNAVGIVNPSGLEILGSFLSWSPNGKKINFLDYKGSYTIDPDGKNLLQVTDSKSILSWSKDCKKIFFDGYISDSNGENLFSLFDFALNPSKSTLNLKIPNQTELNEVINSGITTSNTKFAIKIFSELSKSSKNKNVFISPSSISLALAMAYNGANGNTKSEMAKTLGYQNFSIDEAGKYNNILLRSLLSNQDIKLSIANSLWVKKGINFIQDFININQNSYFSETKQVDFTSLDSISEINDWVSQNTANKIEKILDKIEPDTIIYLLNAIYFKGSWTNTFDKALTKDHDFHLADGSVKKQPMMYQRGGFTHYKDDTVEFVRLPYGKSERTGMYIFLPDKSSTLEEFQKKLTFENLNKWMSHGGGEEIYLTIPKFKIEYQADLIEPLKNLGMIDAFNRDTANFSEITDKPVFISKALHKTIVDVNEEGTEAVAATAIGGAVSPSSPSVVIVDRPFLFAIIDDKTKTLLFLGAIYDPGEGK